MKLILTIDAEADAWKPSWHSEQPVKNIAALSEAHELFVAHEMRPTYLVDFPVASHASSVSILRSFVTNGQCEIGAHCHPWTTPPFEEPSTQKYTMLSNYPPSLILRKLQSLHNRIIESFDTVPTSFRAGRWGYGNAVAEALHRLGYTVDSSITPLINWHSEFGPRLNHTSIDAYSFDPADILIPTPMGKMLEVPLTIGMIHANPHVSGALLRFARQSSRPRFWLMRALNRLRLAKIIWLSPEQSTAAEMIALTKDLLREHVPVINITFHSSTLQPGLTPFTRTHEEKDRFLADLRGFLRFARSAGIESITLSEATQVVPRPRNELADR